MLSLELAPPPPPPPPPTQNPNKKKKKKKHKILGGVAVAEQANIIYTNHTEKEMDGRKALWLF